MYGLRVCITAGVGIASLTLLAVPPMAPLDVQFRAVRLLSGGDTADSPLGDGTALVMGPTGYPIPPQGYLDAAPNGIGACTV